MKRLYIIAGCNGAGKTTASKAFLPSLLNCHQWVNADEIAQGLSPFNPESVAVQAGRIMLARIQELLAQGTTFAIETTLATRSYHALVKQAQQLGYEVHLVFFFLPSPQHAIRRVAHRVQHGGHFIPNDVVVRRYHAGLKNLTELYAPIVDRWMFYQYQDGDYQVKAEGTKDDAALLNEMIVMEESKPYLSEFQQRFIECCNRAVLEMIEDCASRDECVVWNGENNEPIWVRAREILEKNPGLKRRGVTYTPVEVDVNELLRNSPYGKRHPEMFND